MASKVIAIGNSLMGDDGVALHVIKHLQERLECLGLDVILGETDMDFCLGEIVTGDQLWIIDSTAWGEEPGTVTIQPLDQLEAMGQVGFTLHQLNLLRLIRLQGCELSGYLVGIEVAEVDFSLELSDRLQKVFPEICDQVYLTLSERLLE